MKRFGTKYGGWNLPIDISLDSNSIIYSAGAGEDISFDILMQETYGSNIIVIDPTERSYIHYNEILQFYQTKRACFTGDIQPDYLHKISNSKPDFSKFTYIKKGLWSKSGIMNFYKPRNEQYVSHTLIENMYSANYTTVEVESLKTIMQSLGHNHIDILKLDIEGSEIAVVNQMLDDAIFPRYICIEFDLKLKCVDPKNETTRLINRLLEVGYTMENNEKWNCLFVRH